ncbi:MAG: hypothetical protein L3J69_18800 [Desulfobacula sp.]|nr:hypothetical protein [Desulfobacula sp.]
MNFILFVHQDAVENGDRLKNAIEQNFTQIDIQICKTFNAFKSRLKQFMWFSDHELFILLADTKDRLKELTSLVDLLEEKRLILILPDTSKGITAKAHLFFPRFFTTMSNSYDDLCSVLRKMIEQEKILIKNH